MTAMTSKIQNRNIFVTVDPFDASRIGSRFFEDMRGVRSAPKSVVPKPRYKIERIVKRTLTALTGVPWIPPPTSSFDFNGAPKKY